MAIQLGYDLIKAVFIDTTTFQISWITSLIITTITLLILTRDTQKWKELAFPVVMAWHIAGITPSILIYIGTIIMFSIETLSLQTIGSLLSLTKRSHIQTIGQGIKTTGKGIGQGIKITGKGIGQGIKTTGKGIRKGFGKVKGIFKKKEIISDSALKDIVDKGMGK